MEQGRLRVGDTLDDYCPRERRLTTHAVVALVEDRIKQTRCMTCDFEHLFKNGKVPPKRKRPEAAAALAAQAPDDAPPPQIVAAAPRRGVVVDERAPASRSLEARAAHASETARDERYGTAPSLSAAAPAPGAHDLHEAAVHRRLIRATLPRLEGQPPTPRPIPEFTVRHASASPLHGRRPGDTQRPGGGKGKFRADRGQFGSPRHGSGGSFRGQSHRLGKKGPR